MGSIRIPGRVDRGTTAARRRLSAIAAAAMSLILASAIAPAGAAGDTGPEWLFVQDAPRAKLRPAGKGLVLTLINPSQRVEAFTDRPSRRFTVEPLADFLGSWGSYGFKRTPPNAAINVARADGDQDVLIVELGRPRLHKSGNVSYRVKPLKEKGKKRTDLGRRFIRRADERLSRRLGPTSLFIDDADEEAAHLIITMAFLRWNASFTVSDFELNQTASSGDFINFVPGGNGFSVNGGQTRGQVNNLIVDTNADPNGDCVLLSYSPQSGSTFAGPPTANTVDGPRKALVPGLNKIPVDSTSSC